MKNNKAMCKRRQCFPDGSSLRCLHSLSYGSFVSSTDFLSDLIYVYLSPNSVVHAAISEATAHGSGCNLPIAFLFTELPSSHFEYSFLMICTYGSSKKKELGPNGDDDLLDESENLERSFSQISTFEKADSSCSSPSTHNAPTEVGY